MNREELFTRTDQEILDKFLALIGLSAPELRDKKILDVGAGNCSFARLLREGGISSHVVSIDHQCRNSRVVDEPSFRLAEAQFMPFDNDEFDYVFTMNSIPFVVSIGLSAYGKPSVVDEKGKALKLSSNRADSDALQRKGNFLRLQAVRECIRVVKPGCEVRIAARQLDELKPDIVEAVQDAALGTANILRTAKVGTNERFILRKK